MCNCNCIGCAEKHGKLLGQTYYLQKKLDDIYQNSVVFPKELPDQLLKVLSSNLVNAKFIFQALLEAKEKGGF